MPILSRTSTGVAFRPIGMVSTFSTVVRKETFIGLWKGISPVSDIVSYLQRALDKNPLAKRMAVMNFFVMTVTTQMCSQHWVLLYHSTSHEVCLRVSSCYGTLNLIMRLVSYRKTDKNISPLCAMTFGASARAIAASSFLPFTVIKTRFEVRPLFHHT